MLIVLFWDQKYDLDEWSPTNDPRRFWRSAEKSEHYLHFLCIRNVIFEELLYL